MELSVKLKEKNVFSHWEMFEAGRCLITISITVFFYNIPLRRYRKRIWDLILMSIFRYLHGDDRLLTINGHLKTESWGKYLVTRRSKEGSKMRSFIVCTVHLIKMGKSCSQSGRRYKWFQNFNTLTLRKEIFSLGI